MCLLNALLLLISFLLALPDAHLLILFHLVQVLLLKIRLYAFFIQKLSARVVIVCFIYDIVLLAWSSVIV